MEKMVSDVSTFKYLREKLKAHHSLKECISLSTFWLLN